MQKSLLKLLGIVAISALPMTAWSVGMGGINVVSALGQPLKADIELLAVGKSDKPGLVARLASPEAYKGAGLEYPYGNKFKFQVESHANGEPYLKVTSAQPVSDPFVSLLVDLSWSSGRLLREYTFLLDPPDYVAEQPKPTPVQTVAPVVAQPAAAEPVPSEPHKPATDPVPAVTSKPEPKPEPKIEKPAPAVVHKAPEAAVAQSVGSGEVTVKRGDTLNKIAGGNKPADVSLDRMLVALYRANADQFDGSNMNRIKVGKILRMPTQDELMNISQSDASNEIRAQASDWNAYRQKLAGAASSSDASETSTQVSSGKISSSVADKAPVAKESAKEVLKLSKGDVPGDKATAGAGKSAEDKKNAAAEDAIAKAKAAEEEKVRALALENNLKQMERLAQLKSEAAALAQAQSAAAESAVVAASAVNAASAVEGASEVAAVSQAAPAVPVAPAAPVAVEASPLDDLLAEPLYLGGGLAALLGLGGLGFVLARRKKSVASGKQATDFGATTGRIATPVAPSPETGDFTSTVAKEVSSVEAVEEDVDPISEADLFLNFGRDVQAEEILKDALQNNPSNHQVSLKLLGIYANRKDANAFAAIARDLQASGDDAAWQQAAAMGAKLEPSNPMYAGAATIEDADSATMQTAALNATPDFVLDAAPAAEAQAVPDLDFDLGGGDAGTQDFAESAAKTLVMDVSDTAETQAAAMDFDVTTTNPSMLAPDFDVSGKAPAEVASESNLDDLIFDVTSTNPSIPPLDLSGGPAAEVVQPEADAGMDFVLDFPVEGAAKVAPAPVDMNLSDINLNLDDVAPAAAAETEHDEHWHEVATKLDLAKAYQEMGDAIGAREILDEVLQEGDDEQRGAAQALIAQL